jgi:hypothetical protein
MALTPDPDRLLRLREALEASWDGQSAFKAVEKVGNSALGQCSPTAKVVQHYYPLATPVHARDERHIAPRVFLFAEISRL